MPNSPDVFFLKGSSTFQFVEKVKTSLLFTGIRIGCLTSLVYFASKGLAVMNHALTTFSISKCIASGAAGGEPAAESVSWVQALDGHDRGYRFHVTSEASRGVP